MLKLPKECLQYSIVDKDNYKLFIVENVVVFPDNILSVDDEAFNDMPESFFSVYGRNVQRIGQLAFAVTKLQRAKFYNLLEIDNFAFSNNISLKSFIAPSCKILG